MSKIVFLGTGTSSGVPLVSCLLKNDCETCNDTKKKNSKNKRGNTSLVIKYKKKNILIDVGKFFYQSAIEWFPCHNITSIDSILITHDHFDAIGGMDDLRDFTNQIEHQIPIYLRKSDLKTVNEIYPYLVDPQKSSAGFQKHQILMFKGGGIAKLKFIELKDSETPIELFGLKITPLEVFHGKKYTCLGFMFGKVVYLSDVSLIPEKIFQQIKECDILILDCLNDKKSHPSHFTYQESLEMILKINPKESYFIGMTHEMNHENYTENLKEWNLKNKQNLKLSYDGLSLDVDL